MHSHWQQQDSEPLFPGLLWSRPENRSSAGKLLLVGGTKQSFAGIAQAYAAAIKSGVGAARVILPDSLRRTLDGHFPEADYAPSNPSGSFGMKALATLLESAVWADGACFAGDEGHSSETIQLEERFFDKYSGQLTLTGDTTANFTSNPTPILDRQNTTLVLEAAELQKLATAARFTTAFTSDMALLQFLPALLDFSKLHAAHLVVRREETMIAAINGQISTTERLDHPTLIDIAVGAAIWLLQHPVQPYEAITTSLYTS